MMKASYIQPVCVVYEIDGHTLLSASPATAFEDPVIVPREDETD